MKINFLVLPLVMLASPIMAADDIESFYHHQGAGPANIDNGQRLWEQSFGERSCSSCHGLDLKADGKHVKTAKPIDPMAWSVNPSRYQKQRKVEKWFLRNCKWTLGRECTVQEKLDVLSWLKTL